MIASNRPTNPSTQSHRGIMRRLGLAALLLATPAFLLSGCNLFGGFDKASSREELLIEAKLRLDEGKCAEAVEIYSKITEPDDNVYYPYGWAQLCTAGAPFFKIAASLLKYDSGNGQLTFFGTLATDIMPQTDGKISAINGALATFNNIQNENVRRFSRGMAFFVKAAAYMAKSKTAPLTRAKISDDAVTCYGGNVAACTCAGGDSSVCMIDADATAFGTALNSAATEVAGMTAFGKVNDMMARITALGFSTTLPNPNRLLIITNMLSQ